MGRYNLNIPNLSKSCIFIFYLMISASCLTNRHRNHSFSSNGKIVYHVFDSLEQILSKRVKYMEKRYPDNNCSICVTITPDGDYLKPYNDSSKYLYVINLYYYFPFSRQNVIKNTDRYIEICGNQYPIYLYAFDDVFVMTDSTKNLKNENIAELFDINSVFTIRVNMLKKKILFAL